MTAMPAVHRLTSRKHGRQVATAGRPGARNPVRLVAERKKAARAALNAARAT